MPRRYLVGACLAALLGVRGEAVMSVSEAANVCVLSNTPSEFRNVLAVAADDHTTNPRLPTADQFKAFVSVMRECQLAHGVPEELMDAWGGYLFAAVFLEEVEKHLVSDGLPLATIRDASDSLFDRYGLQWTAENNAVALIDVLKARNVDLDTLSDRALGHIGQFHAARRAERTKRVALP